MKKNFAFFVVLILIPLFFSGSLLGATDEDIIGIWKFSMNLELKIKKVGKERKWSEGIALFGVVFADPALLYLVEEGSDSFVVAEWSLNKKGKKILFTGIDAINPGIKIMCPDQMHSPPPLAFNLSTELMETLSIWIRDLAMRNGVEINDIHKLVFENCRMPKTKITKRWWNGKKVPKRIKFKAKGTFDAIVNGEAATMKFTFYIKAKHFQKQ